jgi:hypothetical protein
MKDKEDLNYWKANAEEDYKQVPISVLRYITELETAVENCSIPDVVGQSKQLESGKSCMMCRKEKENDGHTCCEDCGGVAF